jgi:hypothetical protein
LWLRRDISSIFFPFKQKGYWLSAGFGEAIVAGARPPIGLNRDALSRGHAQKSPAFPPGFFESR